MHPLQIIHGSVLVEKRNVVSGRIESFPNGVLPLKFSLDKPLEDLN
jgi:hypothetical protein